MPFALGPYCKVSARFLSDNPLSRRADNFAFDKVALVLGHERFLQDLRDPSFMWHQAIRRPLNDGRSPVSFHIFPR